MYHTVVCDTGAPYWDSVFDFKETVLHEGKLRAPRAQAVIFNTWNDEGTMASTPTRAFLRHAYGCYYRTLSQADKEGFVMSNQRMYATLSYAITNEQ